MPETAPRPNRALLLKLALVGVVLLVAAVLVARGVDLKGLVHQGLAQIQQAGPWAFFSAMALFPSAAVPLSVFSLTVGSIFGPQLGMPVVIACSLLAITVNMIGTYYLASRALRPLAEMLVNRLGYRIPQIEEGDIWDVILLVRVTPALPFFAQNYLLGLMRAPLGKYLVVSCAVQWSFNTAFILFGDALLHGKGKVAMLGLGALLALTAGTHLVRRHYARRKKAA